MQRILVRTVLLLIACFAASSLAFAQGGTTKSALSGTVFDSDGGAIPGATVVVKNNSTGVATTVVTNANGTFDVPALDAGIYTVTVSLSGFKTLGGTDVEPISGTPGALKLTRAVGGVNETVEVRGGSQLITTASTMVSSTIRIDQRTKLPLITRNALNFGVLLPGLPPAGTNHCERSSPISGLPQSAISITVDGANVQDKYTRSTDGFFVNIHPKLDLIEESPLATRTS